MQEHDIFDSPNHQNTGLRNTGLQTGYADVTADAKAEADTDANGIHTKHNMSLSPCWANIINQLWYLVYLAKPTNSINFSYLYYVSH